MSQFSESLHFHGTPTELLSSCSAAVVVVAANEHWTTFLPYRAGTPGAAIAGLVVRWHYAEDHAWGVEVRHGERVVFTDSLLSAMAELAAAPNREAALAEWFVERDEVEEVFGTDEEIIAAFK